MRLTPSHSDERGVVHDGLPRGWLTTAYYLGYIETEGIISARIFPIIVPVPWLDRIESFLRDWRSRFRSAWFDLRHGVDEYRW